MSSQNSKIVIFCDISSHERLITSFVEIITQSDPFDVLMIFQSESDMENHARKYSRIRCRRKYRLNDMFTGNSRTDANIDTSALANYEKPKKHGNAELRIRCLIIRMKSRINKISLSVKFHSYLLLAWAAVLSESIAEFKSYNHHDNKDPRARRSVSFLFLLFWNALRFTLQKVPSGYAPRALRTIIPDIHRKTAIKKLMQEEMPGLTVLAEENLFYGHHFIVNSSHEVGAPVLIVPFTIVNQQEWLMSFQDAKNFQASGIIRRILYKAYPEWGLVFKDKPLIFEPRILLQCETFRLRPSIPWLINSGAADIIAVENKFMFKYYLKAGIAPNKLRLIGSPSDDYIFTAISQRKNYGYNHESRARILIGIPPNQFGGALNDGIEFTLYTELLTFLIESIRSTAAIETSITASLHPRIIDNQEVMRLLNNAGISVDNSPIEELLVESDLYVSVSSATIRNAVTCGVPVINYDAYRYHYDDYNSLPAVFKASTKLEYTELLQTMLSNHEVIKSARIIQEETAKLLFFLDGETKSRLIKVCYNLCNKNIQN